MDENNLQKLKRNGMKQNVFLNQVHPEQRIFSYEDVLDLAKIVRNANGQISSRHRTIPILTKNEMARVIGLRAAAINDGAPSTITDASLLNGLTEGREIAQMELLFKCLPFIIKRPLPDGTFEFWHVSDLEVLT
jgi:hypothetical protein